MRGISGLRVYIDDMVIYTKTFDEHVRVLREVFHRLKEAGLFLKTKKCCLFMRSLNFLGFVVSADGYRVDTECAEIIDRLQVDDLKSLRTFIGVASRLLIPNFAEVMAPLYELKEHYRKWFWEARHKQALQSIKDAVWNSINHTFPDSAAQKILCTDASEVAIGGALFQMNHVDKEPLRFYSCKLTKSEMKYGVSKREWLALTWCLEQVRQFVMGGKYQPNIMTDYKSVLKLNYTSSKNVQDWLPRWSSALEEFDLKITYSPEHEACYC
jgi:hypothetical protein